MLMATEHYSRHLIQIARHKAGLTQHQLAGRAATSQAAISAYESGRRSPSVDTLSRILAAAGFELRMRLAEPDTHEGARHMAEALLPREALDAFAAAERQRVRRARRGAESRA
jgi:transcriptional regulator with XRE-family HTH domain